MKPQAKRSRRTRIRKLKGREKWDLTYWPDRLEFSNRSVIVLKREKK